MARVSIAGLEREGAIPFFIEEEPEKLGLAEDALRFEGPIRVEGHVVHTGLAARVEGVVRCRRSFSCDRCLAPAAEDQEIPFSEDIPAGGRADGEELLPEGDALELSGLLRDTILAAQPIQILCSPECKGLCPSCGANLNFEECGCERGAPDPRWAALQSWKQREEQYSM